jgi:hypothetical protein
LIVLGCGYRPIKIVFHDSNIFIKCPIFMKSLHNNSSIIEKGRKKGAGRWDDCVNPKWDQGGVYYVRVGSTTFARLY